MAALTVTAANVFWVEGTEPLKDQISGAAFVAGDCVYQLDDGSWRKAQCDGTALEAGSNRLGIALATADRASARVSIASSGATVELGTGTAGVLYCPGRSLGLLNPIADLASTDKVTPFALGIGSNRVYLQRIYNAGAVLA